MDKIKSLDDLRKIKQQAENHPDSLVQLKWLWLLAALLPALVIR